MPHAKLLHNPGFAVGLCGLEQAVEWSEWLGGFTFCLTKREGEDVGA